MAEYGHRYASARVYAGGKAERILVVGRMIEHDRASAPL
jgi:hypothetical protein